MIEASRFKQLLLFLLLALVSYIVYEKYFNSDQSNDYEPFTKGYALTGVVIQTTNELGKIVTTIESPAVVHYADTETTQIEEPHIRLHEASGDWVFKSVIGEINPEQTEIFFPQDVFVNLDNGGVVDAVNNNLQINTTALTVDVINKIGKTAAEITMNQVGSQFKGKGAVVNFNQQEIEILSEMYAEFEN